MSKSNRMTKNDEAVSPIVATLVLIVVAIVGAAAVGMLLGTFSSNVSKQANTADTASAASTKIVVGGSTTCQPIVNTMAKMYMSNYTGVKIDVQGGGSGAGVTGTGMGLIDIGMTSEPTPINAAQQAAYPNLKAFEIGGSGVVVIVRGDETLATAAKADLTTAYSTAGVITGALATGGIIEVVGRSDASGTADTFKAFLGVSSDIAGDANHVYKSSNGDVVTEVTSAVHKLGFADLDAVWGNVGTGATNVKIIAVDTYAGATDATGAKAIQALIKAQIKTGASTGAKWYATRRLNLLVNGQPTPMQQDFISYVQSPAAKAYFNAAGLSHVTEINA